MTYGPDMSTSSLDKELQERLREASAIGDVDEVRTLVASGVNVNSQNEINGWTCLHWACKRNHKHIVSFLLGCGADKEILTAKDELASQLTSKADIKRLLGVEVEDDPEVKDPELPIVPNYLSNPPFMFSKLHSESDLVVAQHLLQNGSEELTPSSDSDSSSLSPEKSLSVASDEPAASDSYSHEPQSGESIPVKDQNGTGPAPSHNHTVPHTVPVDPSVEPHLVNHAEPHLVNHAEPHLLNHELAHTVNGVLCSPPLASTSPGLACSNGSPVHTEVTSTSSGRQPSVPQQLSYGSPAGSMPAFQPFFFTSTFPVSVQELVLKVRIQNPHVRENDFIEVELDRQQLTFRSLLRVCCRELGLGTEHVEKIRKLPNTMLRKDKDVARLQDFQELEVVLVPEKSEGLSLFSGAGGLTDRPCYNMKASRLTY